MTIFGEQGINGSYTMMANTIRAALYNDSVFNNYNYAGRIWSVFYFLCYWSDFESVL